MTTTTGISLTDYTPPVAKEKLHSQKQSSNGFFETKEKSLDQIEDIIEAEWKSPSKSRIFWARRPVGKKSNGQPMNEQYIHMEKTNRFPFIEIHEPFLK